MKKALLTILLILFCLSALICVYARENNIHERKGKISSPINPSNSFDLTASEIKTLETLANKGDVNAAYRLAEYYQFAHLNEIEEEKWLTKAAELGHNDAQMILAILLYQHHRNNEAIFWAKKAKAQNKDMEFPTDLENLIKKSSTIKK